MHKSREFVLQGASMALGALAVAVLGCAAPGGVGTDPEPDVDSKEGALLKYLTGDTSKRADYTSTITLHAGTAGTWSAFRYCPSGTFAVGYHQRVQPGPASGDDTALNAIELECMDPRGNVFGAQSHLGARGTWYPGAVCAGGSYIMGGAVRTVAGGVLESGTSVCPRSGRCNEQVGAVNARMRCSDSRDIQAKGGWTSGTYGANAFCPASTSVCGISVRFQSGGVDQSGVEGVQLACCSNPSAPYSVNVTERIMDGIHARTFSKETGPHTAPLVFVEGFDTDGDYTVDALSLLVGLKSDKTFIGKLLSVGYSVTFVDLTKNSDAIATNARRVGALVNRLWLDSAQVRGIKLVGASMGGLIVTTAAAMKDGWAALNEPNPGWSFWVDHVTTLDTPHGGVYIPQAIYHLVSRFQEHNAAAKALLAKLTSPASQQMLYVPFNVTFENSHQAWQKYYDRVLAYIRKSDIRFVGVVNGAWNNTPQYANWISGLENIRYLDDGYTTDAYASLRTQPGAGGLVAQINTSGWGLTDENKSYFAFGNYPVVENLPGGWAEHWKTLREELGSKASVPVYERTSFVPSWSAAGIPWDTWRNLPADQNSDLAWLETMRGPLAGSALSPFDRIIHTNVNNEHPFVPSALVAPFMDELRIAYAMPHETALWTGWLDRDDPSGNGDGEHFSLFTGLPCKAALTAECRRVSDGVDWSRTGEVMRCSPAGANCLSADQPDKLCDDYEVRFACPHPTIVGPWLDRDNPSGSGDGEHLSLLISESGVCAQPIGIECQTTAGVDVSATGEAVYCQANLGLECLSANQSDQSCEDYQVRFACPQGGAWTGWLNGDLPDGTGDGEQLGRHVASGAACPRPLAAECRRRSDGRDWKLVGQNMICTAAEGGFCGNDQNGGWCEDYEVRFFCPAIWPAP